MLALLAEASLRAIVMAMATMAVLTLFRIREARVRHAAWSAMLVVMLLSPLAIAWGPKARVPMRAAEPIVRAVGLDSLASLASQLPPMQLPARAPAADAPTWLAVLAALAVDWRVLAGGLYGAVALVLLGRIAIGIVRVRRLLRGAISSTQDSTVTCQTRPGPLAPAGGAMQSQRTFVWLSGATSMSSDGSVQSVQDVRQGYLIHPACAVPVVVGWLRPRIILPVDCHEWPAERLAMVLAHEQAHARRRDSIVRLLSLINRAVFWFHPLAWWLHREIAALAEESCDAAAVAAVAAVGPGSGRRAYADCLLSIARRARQARDVGDGSDAHDAGDPTDPRDPRDPRRPGTGGNRIEPIAIGMASTALGRRVRAILADPLPSAPPRRAAFVKAVSALALLACLTATPVQTIAALRRTAGDDPLRGFAGTFVVRDDRGLTDVRINPERADLRVSPCSTFKLPFAIMFLEHGIVRDLQEVVRYDARLASTPLSAHQPGAAHDQTLTSAFQESANWYFDSVSRSLDRTLVAGFASRARYGNADVADFTDANGAAEQGSYWYDGRLRISANEQVRFLQRLHNRELGVSARTTDLIEWMALVEETPAWRLAAKTGTCRGAGEDATTFWYVGWVEKADNTYYFALQLEASNFEPASRERIPIARHLLEQLHILD